MNTSNPATRQSIPVKIGRVDLKNNVTEVDYYAPLVQDPRLPRGWTFEVDPETGAERVFDMLGGEVLWGGPSLAGE